MYLVPVARLRCLRRPGVRAAAGCLCIATSPALAALAVGATMPAAPAAAPGSFDGEWQVTWKGIGSHLTSGVVRIDHDVPNLLDQTTLRTLCDRFGST